MRHVIPVCPVLACTVLACDRHAVLCIFFQQLVVQFFQILQLSWPFKCNGHSDKGNEEHTKINTKQTPFITLY